MVESSQSALVEVIDAEQFAGDSYHRKVTIPEFLDTVHNPESEMTLGILDAPALQGSLPLFMQSVPRSCVVFSYPVLCFTDYALIRLPTDI